MIAPFQLKKTIGEAFDMDLDDSLNSKIALTGLGYMLLPKLGITAFPDNRLIGGIKDFQKTQGLSVDGVMKPDGPTIRRLNEALSNKLSPARTATVANDNKEENERAIREFREKFLLPYADQNNDHGEEEATDQTNPILEKVSEFILRFQRDQNPFEGIEPVGGIRG